MSGAWVIRPLGDRLRFEECPRCGLGHINLEKCSFSNEAPDVRKEGQTEIGRPQVWALCPQVKEPILVWNMDAVTMLQMSRAC